MKDAKFYRIGTCLKCGNGYGRDSNGNLVHITIDGHYVYVKHRVKDE